MLLEQVSALQDFQERSALSQTNNEATVNNLIAQLKTSSDLNDTLRQETSDLRTEANLHRLESDKKFADFTSAISSGRVYGASLLAPGISGSSPAKSFQPFQLDNIPHVYLIKSLTALHVSYCADDPLTKASFFTSFAARLKEAAIGYPTLLKFISTSPVYVSTDPAKDDKNIAFY